MWELSVRHHLAVGPVLAASLVVLALAPCAARAQWTQVPEVPTTALFSLFANEDTLAAGADTTVYLSTDGGLTWRHTAKPVAGVGAITAVRVRNGRLYAGTFGQGVLTSDDLGVTWQAFNQGLVGGFLDSQLDIDDFEMRGDTLYVATAGAGVYLRRLVAAGTWQPTGTVFGPEQATDVNAITLGGGRLLASAGSNGEVFRNDRGEADWDISELDNVGLHPGVGATAVTFTGSGWIVGSDIGVFLSSGGQEPWTLVGLGIGSQRWTAFTTRGGHVWAAFVTGTGAFFGDSGDDGATWKHPLFLPGVFVQDLGLSGNVLYAARGDGLWRRSIEFLAVPPGPSAAGVSFALAGAQPFRDRTQLRFVLPAAGEASIEVFDVMGRSTGQRITGSFSAGPHDVALDASRLGPGVYAALLVAGGARETLRLVHVR